jgi:DnaJ-class molecular chaperone
MPIEIDKWTIINGAKVMEHKTINVTFPPGIDENDVLSLKGAGNEVNEHLKGDVNIHVKLMNNTCFRRQGLDLVMNKKITLKEALCGFIFDIPHMNGKTFSLNNSVNPSIIQPGFRKVIPNLGMMKDNMTGNLIIELEIEFPESLTPEQTEGIKNIL